ncbi:protein SIEL isoform X3 [Canna indica]|uniref:Protein SIEL isoform X3 n=1 Tax=Canna indica TaxID=4628 RepID=A0AAQ3Q7I4_9LILI|nr:protein SIEL isoform X3 [Canna indica]
MQSCRPSQVTVGSIGRINQSPPVIPSPTFSGAHRVFSLAHLETMERALLEGLLLRIRAADTDPRLLLQVFLSARSLVINPDSSESTRCSVVDALVGSLRHHADDPAYVRASLKILGDAAALSSSLAPSVVSAVRPFLDTGDSLAADAVAALAFVVEAEGADADDEVGDGGGLSLVASALDGNHVLSLASSPFVAVRSRIIDLLVRSVEKGGRRNIFGHHLVIQAFVGLAMDIYPLIRRTAVYGMIALLREAGGGIDSMVVECFYGRAVVLLKDEEEAVRLASVKLVRIVIYYNAKYWLIDFSMFGISMRHLICIQLYDQLSECGEIFAANHQGAEHSEQMDVIFIQLCAMARDMCMKVRCEAFIALGRVKLVHESVLLQSISKKILGIKSGKAHVEDYVKRAKTSLSLASGIFVHGIEDEFYEVREAACRSLGMLTIFSVQFSCKATNLLMDMLNDDVESVRLQTLQTLFHMATHDRLTMQDKHMQMFLGLLADISASVRHSARKLLQLVKLPDLVTCRETVDCLIRNLERFPEEEEDIFFALSCVGKNHKKFSAKLANEFAKEIDVFCGELILDSLGVAAKLVLFISSSFSNGQHTTDIPKALFSYAIPFSGKIAHAFKGSISQDTLLAYLFSHSKEVDKKSSSSMPVHFATSDVTCKGIMTDFNELLACPNQPENKGELLNEEIMQSIRLNLKRVDEAWLLIKSHCTHEVQNMLRACKEELEIIAWNAGGSASAFLEFTALYIQVVWLTSEIWDRFEPKKSCIIGMTALDIRLERLDMNLRRLRLSRVGISAKPILERLASTVPRLEFLCEGPCNLSAFAKEVKHACAEGTSILCNPCVFHKLLELFYPKKITYFGTFKQKKAEVQVVGNDSENPLTFVSGLPVGIPFHITLYDILNSDRLWLLMAIGESIQYVFLDLCHFEGSNAVKKSTFSVPFYGTPKAASFLLKACIVMECPSEYVTKQEKSKGGPIGDFAMICVEKDVHFINANIR